MQHPREMQHPLSGLPHLCRRAGEERAGWPAAVEKNGASAPRKCNHHSDEDKTETWNLHTLGMTRYNEVQVCGNEKEKRGERNITMRGSNNKIMRECIRRGLDSHVTLQGKHDSDIAHNDLRGTQK